MKVPMSTAIYAFNGIFQRMWERDGPRRAKAYFGDILSKLHESGCSHVESFPMVDEGKWGYYSQYHPYKRDWKERPVWWKRTRELLKLAAKNKVHIDWVPMSRYTSRRWITSFGAPWLRPEADRRWIRFITRLMRMTKRLDYDPSEMWMRISNEIGHRDKQQGVELAQLHARIYEKIKNIVPVHHQRMDVSHSDFCKLEEPGVLYIEPFGSGAEDFGWQVMMLSDYLQMPSSWQAERPIEASWGDDDYNRYGWIEWHDFLAQYRLDEETEPGSGRTYRQLMDGAMGWRKVVWSLDGNRKGGEVLGFYRVPGTSYVGPSMVDIQRWARLAYKEYRPRVWLVYMPMHIFVMDELGYLYEDLDRINYTDIEVISNEWLAWKPK